MEEQNSMKINQLPSKTWYWLGLNDTKVKWAAGAPCEICAEEPSADNEITDFPETVNTGAGKETDILFAPEQTKNWSVSAKEGKTKQVTLSIGQGKETVSSGKICAAAEEGASLTVFEVFEPAQPLLEYLGVRSSTRASMMFYNTPEEIDALIESVSTIRRRMGYGE